MPEAYPGFPNPAAPQGSAYYYVARFCVPERRDEVATWLAWFDHIDRIALQARDPGVSRLKLDWWREEAGMALQGKARHPLARALSRHLESAWQVQQMQRALEGVEQRILRQRASDTSAFRASCARDWGSRMCLLGRAEDAPMQDLADRAGTYYATTERLQYLGRDISQDHLPLPKAELRQQGLGLEELQSGRHSAALQRIASGLLEATESAWREVQPRAIAIEAFDPVLRLTAQGRRVARLLRRADFQTQAQAPQPTPLGLLWSAWRRR